jgi:hypothetical protein
MDVVPPGAEEGGRKGGREGGNGNHGRAATGHTISRNPLAPPPPSPSHGKFSWPVEEKLKRESKRRSLTVLSQQAFPPVVADFSMALYICVYRMYQNKIEKYKRVNET